MQCPICKFVASEGRDVKRNTHLLCGKTWLLEMLRQLQAMGTFYTFKARIESASNWNALEVMAMLVGQQLLIQGRFSGAQDLLNRWFANCIGAMPAREQFERYEEPSEPRQGADTRPRRDARQAPSAFSVR